MWVSWWVYDCECVCACVCVCVYMCILCAPAWRLWILLLKYSLFYCCRYRVKIRLCVRECMTVRVCVHMYMCSWHGGSILCKETATVLWMQDWMLHHMFAYTTNFHCYAKWLLWSNVVTIDITYVHLGGKTMQHHTSKSQTYNVILLYRSNR